jgi:hypothetical protein
VTGVEEEIFSLRCREISSKRSEHKVLFFSGIENSDNLFDIKLHACGRSAIVSVIDFLPKTILACEEVLEILEELFAFIS